MINMNGVYNDNGYNAHRSTIDSKTFCVFSTCWFAQKHCKICLDKFMDPNFYNNLLLSNSGSNNTFFNFLQDNDYIFISNSRFINNNLWKKIINTCVTKNIKLNFIILDEPFTHPQVINIIFNYSKNIFLVNHVINQLKNPIIHPFPIGLSWCCTIDYNFNPNVSKSEKDILCLMLFKPHHNRDKLVNLYRDRKYITNYVDNPPVDTCTDKPVYAGGNNHLSIQGFLYYVRKSKFVLDPPGCGIACHRFWEALYYNSIPIVCRSGTPIDKLFEALPCLIINSWNELTQELLEECYEEKYNDILKFKHNNPDVFTDTNSIIEFYKKLN